MALIPLGLRNDTFVHISEVDRGLDCNCACPECAMPLVAKKGLEREHHFAHAGTSHPFGCGGDIESPLHLYAKQVIAEAGYLEVPAFVVSLPPPDLDLKNEIPAMRMSFARVEVEESMVFGRRRVDVVGYTTQGRLLIEICVTSRVRGKKLQEVKAASEAMIEIEVPWGSLFSHVPEGDGSLKQAILDSLGNKRWLFHPEGEELRNHLKKQAQSRREEEMRAFLEKESQSRRDAPPPTKYRELPKIGTNPRDDHPISKRGLHLPSRSGLSEEDYVRELHAFLSEARYDDAVRQQVVRGLRLGGNITSLDIEIAFRLGIRLIH